jgi:hypothetical protein
VRKTAKDELEEYKRDNLLHDDSEMITFYCGMATGMIKCVSESAELAEFRNELAVFFSDCKENPEAVSFWQKLWRSLHLKKTERKTNATAIM